MNPKVKRTIVIIFLLILYLPALLYGVRLVTGAEADVSLLGYTDEVQSPELSVKAIADGSFQDTFAKYIGEKMPLRGVYTKNYNTLQYFCFHQGNRPLGRNHFVFEDDYLSEACVIGNTFDYSLPENVAKLEDVVTHMSSANQKLESLGKHLYVYLVPGKPEICLENIPAKYLSIGNQNSRTALETMTALLADTDIPCLFCEELAKDLEYPAFYPTGIHWSRTYEQTVSQRLISDFSALTGKAYRSFAFTGVEESRTPFWRDADVYNLLNVWAPATGNYYQYKTETTIPENEKPLRITLQGDSFGQGLLYDIAGADFAKNDIIYINRDNYAQYSLSSGQTLLEHDWANLDWQRCLDMSDIIVLEMCTSTIVEQTNGFVSALDAYLDTYIPQELASYYPVAWDASEPALSDITFTSGLWGNEDGFSWTKAECLFKLSAEMISGKGLEITYAVPQQSAQREGGGTVTVTVNGAVIGEKNYLQETNDTLVFQPEDLPHAQDGVYEIVISCSGTFTPKEMGESDDDRDLGIRLMYVGGMR